MRLGRAVPSLTRGNELPEVKDWRETRILAIDPSSTQIGWCVGRGMDYIDSGTIDLEKLVGRRKKDSPDASSEEWAWERIGESWVELDDLIVECSPDRIACEMPRPNHQNQHTNRVMGGAIGVVAAVAMRNGHSTHWGKPIMWIQPDAVRRTQFHKKARRFTAKVFGTTVKEMTEDRADAIGVWSVAWGLLKEEWMTSPENAERWRELVEGG